MSKHIIAKICTGLALLFALVMAEAGPVFAQVAKCTDADTCVSVCPTGTLTRGPCKGSTSASPLVCCTKPDATACTGACTRGTACTGSDVPISGQKCDSVGGEAFTCCKSVPSTGSTPTAEVNAKCFTQDQCSSPKYGGSVDRFVPGMGCPGSMGYCLAPEPNITLSSPVLGQSTVTGLGAYISLMFKYLLAIVTIVALVMFVYGGFKYILSSSFTSIQSGKEILVNATVGLLLIFGSVLILRTLNPATTNLNVLKVYMINAQEFVQLNFCADLTLDKAKAENKFADAGSPAGSIAFDTDPKKYTTAADDTLCGSNYYVQGTSGQTCRGKLCTGADKSKICMSCNGAKGVAECNGKKNEDMSCVNVPFGGTISWSDSTYPVSVFLVPVCGTSQGGGPWGADEGPDKGVKDWIASSFFKGGIFNQSKGEQGNTGYGMKLDSTLLDTLRNDCKNQPNGVVMAIEYHDNCGLADAATAAAGAKSSISAAGDVAQCLTSPDDLLIVTKQDCQGASFQDLSYQPYFSGYAMRPDKTAFGAVLQTSPIYLAGELIASTNEDKNLVSTAMWCGYVDRPIPGSYNVKKLRATNILPKDKRTRYAYNGDARMNPYWSYGEIEKAISGQQPIVCNLDLNRKNAPRNASMYLMGGCGVDWSAVKDGGFPDTSISPHFSFTDMIDFYSGN